MSQARKLASKEPDRYEVGSTGWVTARFTAEEPIPNAIWEKWLRESYDICCGSGNTKKLAKKTPDKKVPKKKPGAAKKKPVRKKARSEKSS